MLKKYTQYGVTFYCDDDLTCVDIDVNPDVTSVTFTLGSLEPLTTVFHLRDVKKQFPNVTELKVCSDVSELHISNHMFPNVRHVKSDNVHYLDETQFLIRISTNTNTYKLENAFCLKSDEVLNLSEIDEIGYYKIGNYALEGCYAQNIDFGTFLTVEFDTHAFDGSGYMLKPYENGIKTFANYLIDIDKNCKELTIPEHITESLETVDFSTLDKITFSNPAFMYVASENPTFPKTVRFESDMHLEAVVKRIFSNKNFENFEVPETNPAFYTNNGILYSKDKKTLILYPKGRAGNFTIPDEVSTIQTDAFARSSVEAVTFPPSLKNVEHFAFINCGVTQLTIMPGELRSLGGYYIGKCFTQCKKLTTVDIAGTVKSIGSQVFSSCSSLSRVILHEGIRSIGCKAFFHCDALIEIELPSSLQFVEDKAFDRVERIILNDNIPKKLIQAIVCSTTDTILDRYKGEKQVIEIIMKADSDIVKNSKFLSEYFTRHPEEQTYTLFIPRYMGPTKVRVLSAKFDRFTNGGYGDSDDEFFEYVNSLFSLTSNILSKQMTAFAVFERYKDATAATYLKRCAKNFAIRLIERNDADSFVRFLGSGLCSRASLKTLCPIASTNENPVFSAYLMKTINESKAKQAAFQI